VVVPGAGTAYGPPKTKRGERTLPLPDHLTGLVRSWRSRLADEFGLMAIKPDAAVAVDEAGRPVHPEAYSDEWARLVKQAGVRPLSLHAARQSSVTAMRDLGIGDHIVAAWHGHDEVVMRKSYSKAHANMLKAAGESHEAATRSG